MLSKDSIDKDLKEAMLAKDVLRTSVVRMLKSELLKVATDGSGREIDEAIIQDCVRRMIKQRKDSAEQFRAGNRPELAEREESEIKTLEAYLPAQMTEEEVLKIVKITMGEIGVKDKSGMGKLMGALMGKLKGKADGSMIKSIVEKELQYAD